MAVPVINTTTSILEGTQWRPFLYQPFATNSPTSWSCANLPAGLTCDPETGLISGSPEVYGVFVLGLIATNGEGASEPLVLTIGLEEGSALQNSPGYEARLDVLTRGVTFPGAASDAEPGLFGKYRDDWLIYLQLTKGDLILDLEVEDDKITLGLKQFVDEKTLVVSTASKKIGSGSGTYYVIYAPLSDKKIRSGLSNYSDLTFIGNAEIEVLAANPIEGFAAETLRFTSRDFPARLSMDKVQAAA